MRPNISYIINSASQHMQSPELHYFSAVKCIIRYVVGILHHRFLLCPSNVILLISYSNWAGCHDTWHSTFGSVLFFDYNLISWSSKKQLTCPILAQRSNIAPWHIVANILWVQQLSHYLCIYLPDSPLVYCDNISALYLLWILSTIHEQNI